MVIERINPIDLKDAISFLNLTEEDDEKIVDNLLKTSTEIIENYLRKIYGKAIVSGEIYTNYFDLPFNSLEKVILLKKDDQIIENPQFPIISLKKHKYFFKYETLDENIPARIKTAILIITARLYHDRILKESDLLRDLYPLLNGVDL